MRRYALRDNQWERIDHLILCKLLDVGLTAHDNRLFVEATLYRYRVGIPWRGLPGGQHDSVDHWSYCEIQHRLREQSFRERFSHGKSDNF